MKTYPYTENGETIELVKKSEHDAVVAEHVGVANQNVVTFTNQVEKLRADNAELLARLEERTQSHLHASARDVQTIQRQSVLLDRLATAFKSFMEEYEDRKCQFGSDYLWQKHEDVDAINRAKEALAAYESAKEGEQP